MSNEKRPSKEKLDCLIDSLVEDLLNTPDDELLHEMEENHINAKLITESVKAGAMLQVQLYRKQKLLDAKKAYREKTDSLNSSAPSREISISRLKERIEQIISVRSEAMSSSLTLAFREGKEMSKDDMQSLLEDFRDLGFLDSEEDGT